MPTDRRPSAAPAQAPELQQRLLDLLDELICRSNESAPGEERAAFGDLPGRINSVASEIGLDPGPGLQAHDRGVTVYDPVQRRRCDIHVDWSGGFVYDEEVRILLPLLRWRRLIASRSTAPAQRDPPPEAARPAEVHPPELPGARPDFLGPGRTPGPTDREARTPSKRDEQQAVWDAMRDRHMTARQLAGKCNMFQDAVRQAISDLRADKHDIRHHKGRGYWRPDAPPRG